MARHYHNEWEMSLYYSILNNKKEIKHLLRILTAAGYAERIKEEDYFRAIPGVILAEIEHIEYETVLARVKQHYSKYFPEAFSTMS